MGDLAPSSWAGGACRQRPLHDRAAAPTVPLPTHASRRGLVWLTLLALLGLSLRCYHYLSDPPVWHDEAAQIYNVLHKGHGDILGPLYYSEACPPLCLAVEKVVVGLLGDGTFALRLVPLLASCAGLVLLLILARRLLSPPAGLWFALLLATSDRLLWHACEAKPYAVDVLVAAVLLAVTALPKRGVRGTCRALVICAALTPAFI